MRIIVLGGGLVGGPMAQDLAADEQFEVTVADRDAQVLADLEAKADIIPVVADLSVPSAVTSLVADYDFVIDAVPGFMGFQTLRAVIEAGKNVIDIAFFPEATRSDDVGHYDIAFVEGACISPKNAKDMKVLRERSKKIVAIGSCACTGMPSAHRNSFNPDQQAEIEHIIEKFDYADKVEPVKDIITVDAQVPGCPMDLNVFMDAVNGLLEEFGHQPIDIKTDQNKINN